MRFTINNRFPGLDCIRKHLDFRLIEESLRHTVCECAVNNGNSDFRPVEFLESLDFLRHADIGCEANT